ncbi:MAG: hypothetical protein RLZZ88_689 [Actinomycetota bacterium]|jgi:(p)ppGpp synthase/HD superfamily hydrolase
MKKKIPPRWQPGIALYCAYLVAAREFAGISRKGGDIPYLSHLMAVSALVMEHGGTEDQAAAALLHDVLEDSKDVSVKSLTWELMAAEVPVESAHNIVAIVQGTSDGVDGQERTEATWHERKTKYHQHLAAKPSDDPSILVSLADKVHNAESTLMQVRAGQTLDEIFANFNFGRAGQEMNYRGLLAAFKKHSTQNPSLARLVTRLERAIEEIFTP